MKNFQPIGTFDPLPLLHQVQLNPELWDKFRLRTEHQMTPHKAVNDIWLRFQDLRPYQDGKDPKALEQVVDEHESIWYPAVRKLTAARKLCFDMMAKVEGERLGRVLITKLAPGKRIDPHVDGGAHAAYFSRYHLVLQAFPGSDFRCGDEKVYMAPGTVWWFKNSVEHEVVNNGADDRIHMIVDIRTSHL